LTLGVARPHGGHGRVERDADALLFRTAIRITVYLRAVAVGLGGVAKSIALLRTIYIRNALVPDLRLASEKAETKKPGHPRGQKATHGCADRSGRTRTRHATNPGFLKKSEADKEEKERCIGSLPVGTPGSTLSPRAQVTPPSAFDPFEGSLRPSRAGGRSFARRGFG
jgi:hypothetical protein